jgi:carboxypeptidase Taq
MKQEAFSNPVIKEILGKYRDIWAINHLYGVAYWDMETYMPQEGISARGEAFAKAGTITQRMFLGKDFTRLIKKAKSENRLSDPEKGVVRILVRTLDKFEKLPPKFLEEYSLAMTKSNAAWKKAKFQSDFSIFRPHLEKITELSLKKADYLGYKKSPYNALLDEFEEDLTINDLQPFFSEIKSPLKKLLEYIKNSPNYKKSHPIERMSCDLEAQKSLSLKALKILNCDWQRMRLDTSAHPFTVGLSSPGDARITTRYSGRNFADSIGSTIHEFGHALHALQVDASLTYSPIFSCESFIVDESQSRFWENFVGKDPVFIRKLYPDILKLNPKMKKFGISDVFSYFNLVRPSLIRTEADEVTYHFHIMIRYELEKDLIEGRLKVRELPGAWNQKYLEYLGIEPKKDSQGVLQDVHWSEGNFGYFPTYSMGTALSAMVKHHFEKDSRLSISQMIKTPGGVSNIQSWLKRKIHRYGATYTSKEFIRKSFGEDLNPKYLLNYLDSKYREIY